MLRADHSVMMCRMNKNRQDIIAIPTFNRVHQLLACLNCLQQLRGLDRYRIFVRDDASSEFGVREIALLAPQAEKIERNKINLGPDANQILLFKDCIEAGARRILVLDSDMIVSPSLLEVMESVFERTDGFLGLYNSAMHKKRRDVDSDLIEKWSAGGAATCWDSGVLSRVIERHELRATETWDMSAISELHESKRRILVSRRSYAQHLGIVGTNNGSFGNIEYGHGFVIETDMQARFMADAFDHIMLHQDRFMPAKRRKWRLSRIFGAHKRSR